MHKRLFKCTVNYSSSGDFGIVKHGVNFLTKIDLTIRLLLMGESYLNWVIGI